MLVTLRREAEALRQRRHAITVDDDAGGDLLGSIRELHSAFSYLVANAVRYPPAGGNMQIVLDRSDDGGAVLSVRDSGHGIPAATPPRIDRQRGWYGKRVSGSVVVGGRR